MSLARRAELLGLAIDPATMDAAVERCLAWCASRREPHIVVTANAALLCMMRHDPELRDACRAGDLVVADGMSVVWAMRAAGEELPERVTGVDLMARLLEEGGKRGLSAYFLGARPEVVEKLARSCEQRYPGLVIAGYRDGYFGEADHATILEGIREAHPDMLFVGMPSPFKDKWLEQNRHLLDVPVIIGVGGSFDVHAGYVKRAPPAFQAAGMEWAWRLMMEPRRMWKRYLTTNSEFLWVAGRAVVGHRLAHGRPEAPQLPGLAQAPEASAPHVGDGAGSTGVVETGQGAASREVGAPA